MSHSLPVVRGKWPLLKDAAATALATGFGAGYSPIAPGTAGTAVGVLLFWPLARLPPAYQLAATLVLFSLAVPAAGYLARRMGAKDPGRVVVDEIVGAWVSLLLVPWNAPVVIAAFVLFRAMDVVKPQPARRFEALPGGWGIVLDDVMAGVYANVLLRVGLMLSVRLT